MRNALTFWSLAAFIAVSCTSQPTKVEPTKPEETSQSLVNFSIKKETLVDSNEYFDVELNHPIIIGNGFERINDELHQQLPNFKYEMEEFVSYKKEAESDTLAYEVPNGYFNSDYEVFTDSSSYLSFVFYHYQFSGGAHGSKYVQVFNIDLEAKNMFTIVDEYTNIDSLKQALFNSINQEVQDDEMGCWGIDSIQHVDNVLDNIVVTTDSLFVFFSDYEVCPYATGNPPIFLPRK